MRAVKWRRLDVLMYAAAGAVAVLIVWQLVLR